MRYSRTLFLAFLIPGCTELDLDDWSAVLAGVGARYPTVEGVTTAELQSWLARPDTLQPLLLDVRQTEEYAISHLPGARRVLQVEEALAVLAEAPLDTPIVLYCSIGYRSAGLAQDLQRRGVTQVRNLEGSIFAWANEDRPLVDDEGRPTTLVHPYGKPWSGLLRPELRAPR